MPPRILPSSGKVVACDVDGTLVCGGSVRVSVVAKLRKMHQDGCEIILWSARGTEYAKRAAKLAGVESICAVIIGKPAYLIDDMGGSWLRYSRTIKI